MANKSQLKNKLYGFFANYIFSIIVSKFIQGNKEVLFYRTCYSCPNLIRNLMDKTWLLVKSSKTVLSKPVFFFRITKNMPGR